MLLSGTCAVYFISIAYKLNKFAKNAYFMNMKLYMHRAAILQQHYNVPAVCLECCNAVTIVGIIIIIV